jgi:hypothetical protein
MKKTDRNPVAIIDPNNFMHNAAKAEDFNRVTKELINESTSQLINPIEQKRAEDWSVLANQIVGAEIF